MRDRDDRLYLIHIDECLHRIEQYTSAGRDPFFADTRTQDAAYEMLAGAHPFAASTAFDVHSAILAGRVTPLRAHLPEAPPSWQHFFDQALALRIESRPQTALQLFSAFRQSIEQVQRDAAV